MATDRAKPKISVLADCAGSATKRRLRDLNFAFARADVDGILAFFSEDFVWHIIGDRQIHGVAAARATLEAMQGARTRELVIHSIITDGRVGVVNGEITTEPAGIVAFCDVCRFDASGKVDQMKSYTVEVKSSQS